MPAYTVTFDYTRPDDRLAILTSKPYVVWAHTSLGAFARLLIAFKSATKHCVFWHQCRWRGNVQETETPCEYEADDIDRQLALCFGATV